MGEAHRGMETLMVCDDYRHAGMMSYAGCVYLWTHLLQHDFAYVNISVYTLCYSIDYTCVCVCVYSVWVVLVKYCDNICQHVLPCSDHNPEATGSRAGLWVEELNSVTSLPGHSWSNPSHLLWVGWSIPPLLQLLTL